MIKRSRLFVRGVFVLGAVLDGLMLIPMLVPEVGGAVFGLSGFAPSIEYRYAMGIASALMAGWTVLLIWGAIRPIERRALLAFTAVPAVSGLFGANVYAAVSGLVEWADIAATLGVLAVLFGLFVTAFLVARGQAIRSPQAGK